MGRKSISIEIATEIKRLLTNKCPPADIAAAMGVSQATISNIKNGRVAYEAPWPSGTVGAMPAFQAQANANNKRFATNSDWQTGTIWDQSEDRIYGLFDRDKIDAFARGFTCLECGYSGFQNYPEMWRHQRKHEDEKAEADRQRRMAEAEIRQQKYEEEQARLRAENPDWEPPKRDPNPPIDFTAQDIKYSFEDCKLMKPEHVLVQMAKDDEYMQKAVQMGFSLWGSGHWDQPEIILQIKQFRDRIERFENPSTEIIQFE